MSLILAERDPLRHSYSDVSVQLLELLTSVLVMRVRVPIFLTLLALAGCSMHPLPEDVTRKTTFDIVKRMRCEIQLGIEEARFAPDVKLDQIAVGFDFTFLITESDNAAAGKLKFVNPMSGGTFSLDFDAAAAKARSNQRDFRVIDTLARIKNEPDCDPDSQRRNFVYPMTGTIGLDEMVVTFAKVRDLTGFRKLKDTSSDVFTDKLIFTTTFTAGVTPKLEVAVGKVGSLELTNASINGNATRRDEHQVTIALAIADSKSGRTDARMDSFSDEAIGSRANDIPSAVPGPVLPPDTGTATSKVIQELNRQRYRDDLRDFPSLRIVP